MSKISSLGPGKDDKFIEIKLKDGTAGIITRYENENQKIFCLELNHVSERSFFEEMSLEAEILEEIVKREQAAVEACRNYASKRDFMYGRISLLTLDFSFLIALLCCVLIAMTGEVIPFVILAVTLTYFVSGVIFDEISWRKKTAEKAIKVYWKAMNTNNFN